MSAVGGMAASGFGASFADAFVRGQEAQAQRRLQKKQYEDQQDETKRQDEDRDQAKLRDETDYAHKLLLNTANFVSKIPKDAPDYQKQVAEAWSHVKVEIQQLTPNYYKTMAQGYSAQQMGDQGGASSPTSTLPQGAMGMTPQPSQQPQQDQGGTPAWASPAMGEVQAGQQDADAQEIGRLYDNALENNNGRSQYANDPRFVKWGQEHGRPPLQPDTDSERMAYGKVVATMQTMEPKDQEVLRTHWNHDHPNLPINGTVDQKQMTAYQSAQLAAKNPPDVHLRTLSPLLDKAFKRLQEIANTPRMTKDNPEFVQAVQDYQSIRSAVLQSIPLGGAQPAGQPEADSGNSQVKETTPPAGEHAGKLTVNFSDKTLAEMKSKGWTNTGDYDYEGYVKEHGALPKQGSGHLPDTYKLPNHMTFSTDSKYSSPEHQGGVWQQDKSGKWNFYASPYNLKWHTPHELRQYFKDHEPDAVLHLPATGKQPMAVGALPAVPGAPTVPDMGGLIGPNRNQLDKEHHNHAMENIASRKLNEEVKQHGITNELHNAIYNITASRAAAYIANAQVQREKIKQQISAIGTGPKAGPDHAKKLNSLRVGMQAQANADKSAYFAMLAQNAKDANAGTNPTFTDGELGTARGEWADAQAALKHVLEQQKMAVDGDNGSGALKTAFSSKTQNAIVASLKQAKQDGVSLSKVLSDYKKLHPGWSRSEIQKIWDYVNK